MATLFVVLLFFNTFRFTENRWCSGVNGLQCCNGYTLNKLTWSCEKCPTGYTGNCLTRCIPPSFGEDCQSVCSCAKGLYCHFIYGCSQPDRNETKIQKSSSTSIVSSKLTVASFSPTSPIVGKRVSLSSFTKEISESLTKHITTTVNHLSKDDDFFKNNYVFLIIIVLIGVFVLSFAFFVATYTYFKCFRQKTNSSGEARENELQAHYKSLDFEAMVAETTIHQMSLEQRERLISDSAYLSPVFACNENQIDSHGMRQNETRAVNNEILRESASKRQQTGHQAINSGENTVIISTGDQSEHVYIEITEDEIESANAQALDVSKNTKSKISTAMNGESTYVNNNN